MRCTRILALAGLAILIMAALARNLPRLAPGMQNWAEPGNVAAALVQGRGFSDPFDGGTGPTAWTSPLPVWVEAAVFAGLGVKSAASSVALLALTVLGLAAANLFLAAALEPHGRAFAIGACAAFLAGVTLVPSGPLEVLSEAWLDILLCSALLWSALRVHAGPSTPGSLGLVACGALAALDNAGLALALGAVSVFLAATLWSSKERRVAPLAAVLAAAAAVGLWTGRNAGAFHRFVPLKSNLWFELHLANVDSADGLPRMETVLRRLPYFDVHEFERYATLGEAAYVDSFRPAAIAAIRANPGHFAANVLRRLGQAAVFCRREGGGAFTRHAFLAQDSNRLALAGEFIPSGTQGGFWTRIDADPAFERSRLNGLGLADPEGAWEDWRQKRIAYDELFHSLRAVATGFLTAGVPVAALLGAALLWRGSLGFPATLAFVIGACMVLPFVMVNHNDRHQLPLMAVQAVAIGAFVQALVGRITPR